MRINIGKDKRFDLKFICFFRYGLFPNIFLYEKSKKGFSRCGG